MVTFAICGLGNIGKVHLENLLSLRGCQVAGIFDRNSEDTTFLAERFGVKAYPDFEALLADRVVDAVVISTPTSSHRELASRTLAARKHLFIEKPLADTLEDAEAIAKEAGASQRVAQAGLCERFNPQYIEAKGAVSRGELGEVRYITSSRIGPYEFGDASWPLGVLDTAVHNLDLILWISNLKPRAVFAQGTQIYQESSIFHAVTTSIQFENGGCASDQVIWMREAAHPLRQCARSRMLLAGDKASFEIDLNARPSALLSGAQYRMCDTVILGGPSYYGCLKLQFEEFMRSIEMGTPVLAPLEEALNAQRLVMAAAASLESGAAVSL